MEEREIVISADGHVQETDAMWERVPEPLRSQCAPSVESHPDGVLYHSLKKSELMDVEVMEGSGPEDRQREFRNDPSGGTDLALRRADQEADGVHAEVIFPNDLLEIGSRHDPEMNFGVARVYNDWVFEIFAPAATRCLPVAIIPTDDIDEAVLETDRCLAKGFRSVMLPCANAWMPYDLPVYEPLWSRIEEAGIPVNFHVFTASVSFGADFAIIERMSDEDFAARRTAAAPHIAEYRKESLATTVLGMAAGMSPLVHLTGGGVLERHPDLRFIITEAEAGWLAWTLQAMDAMQARRRLGLRTLPLKASEYFLRQGAITFSDDAVAMANIELTGTDCLMWGNDYPHDEGTYPNSENARDRIRGALKPDQASALFAGNAARIYGFDLDALARESSADAGTP
ncbi:MAG: amidohydrolase family protein [Myxococcota bacterium]|nr:amidohydrolase family protein [Myxococcota bacterium]